MKLLLDEMYPYSIAEQLRVHGHDAVAVGERAALRGAPDRAVFAVAQSEGRALVTDNRSDYQPLEAEWRARGESHHCLILTSNRRFPRGRQRTVGRLVRALHRFLSAEATAYADSPSFTHWLR